MTEYFDLKGEAVVRGLESLADSHMPPSTVDVAQAIADGRHQRRRHFIGTVACSVTALAAVAGIAFAGLAFSADSAHGTSAATLTAGKLTITGPDPFVVGAGFGWLPNGVDYFKDAFVNGGVQATALTPFTTPHPGALSTFSLKSYPDEEHAQNGIEGDVANMLYPTDSARQVTLTESAAAQVNGAPAYWITARAYAAGDAAMLFQLPDGRWADVLAQGLGSDAQPVLRHVAETVTADSKPIPLPLSISGLSKGTRISSFTFDPEEVVVRFDLEIDGTTVEVNAGSPGFVDNVHLGTCKSANTLEVCMGTSGPALPPSFHDGLQGLADDATLTGAKPSTWTTDVFPSP